jgi:hypothetical protein
MSRKRRRVRPFRFGHDKMPPPCVYEEVAEALCEVLRCYVVKHKGRCRLVEKREGRLPSHPTDTLPYTEARTVVYQVRRMLGENLHHPDDARWPASHGWRGRKMGEAFLYRSTVDQRASARACACRADSPAL